MKKRLLAIILAVMMVATSLPLSVAEELATPTDLEESTEVVVTTPEEEPAAEEKQETEAEPEAAAAEEVPASPFVIDGTVLTAYTGDAASVTVPDGVTVIGEKAFYGNEALTKVTLPASVEEIGKDAFAGCVNLTKVVLGANSKLAVIGARAFAKDTKLDCSFADAIATVDSTAFAGCTVETVTEEAKEEPAAPAKEVVVTEQKTEPEAVSEAPAAAEVEDWALAPTVTVTQTGDSSVKVSWTFPKVTVSGQVFEVVDGKNVLIGATTATYKTITGVSTGEHTYIVRPYKKEGTSYYFGNFSTPVTVNVVVEETPDWALAPTLTAVQTANQTVKLSWSFAKVAASVQILEVVNGKYSGLGGVGSATTTKTLTGVAVGKHTYVIRPYTKEGTTYVYGKYSAAVTVDVVEKTVEDWALAPTVSLEQTAAGTVKVSWTFPKVTVGGQVYEVVDGKNVLIGATTANNKVITGLAEGTTHTYIVRPYKKEGTSYYFGEFSKPVSINVVQYEVEDWAKAPTLTVTQIDEGKLQFNWTHAVIATSVQLLEVVSGKYTGLGGVGAATTTKTFTGVTEGKHTYVARSYVKEGTTYKYGEYSKPVTVEVVGTWGIAPTVTAVQNGDKSVLISWTYAKEAAAMQILEVVNGKYTGLGGTTATSKTLSNVSIGEHTYVVRAYKKEGTTYKYGSYSVPVTVNVTEAVEAPVLTGAAVVRNEVTLTFNAVDGVDAYEVFEKVDGAYNSLGTVTDTSLVLDQVAEGAHTYAVTAIMGSRVSAYSNEMTATIAESWTWAPELTAVQTDAYTVQLDWTFYGDAATVQVLEYANGKYTALFATTATTKTLTNVTEGEHTYVIRTYKKVGSAYNFSAYGEPVVVNVEHVAVAPVIAEPVVNGDIVTLSWTHDEALAIDYTYIYWRHDGEDSLAAVLEGGNSWTCDENLYGGTKLFVIVGEYKNADNEATMTPEAEVEVTFTVDYVTIDDVEYRLDYANSYAKIRTYYGDASSLTIPASVEDLPVLYVGAAAFKNNTTLTSIDLPDCIEVIEEEAFMNCSNLREMN